ncbi:MAG: polysaccharide biosynthesis tyrosine autokinase [Acidobacteriaceae bacterium]|jgi:capsular exopolysaccharide synthesis family protein|nr:polysaccharide biosynthesis tyrosine autokinase [Acidobacteriaceae bacterium]
MNTNRPDPTRPVSHGGHHEKHISDYVRILYKRRWIIGPVFLVLFVIGVFNALQQTPIYQSQVQLLIEKDAPNVATLDQMFQSQDGWMSDDFYQTQYRILQSRSLAKLALDNMKLWDAPRLGSGPAPKTTINLTGLLWSAVYGAIDLAKRPFQSEPPATVKADASIPQSGETAAQSARIAEFLGGLSIVPVRNSRIAEIRYTSSDPVFAAAAANAVAKAYIQQNMEFKFATSKDATDFLSSRLAEQRKAVEASEAALQAFKEKNGTVSVADSGSNIVVARLTDLNVALTKTKTDRINKEALYNQLKAIEGTSAMDALPVILSNDYIQKLRSDLSDLQRQQAQLAERYGPRHAEMIKIQTAVTSADAKLRLEIQKVVESVKAEYQAALSEEQSLQSALDAQKTEALSLNRKGIEASVLQRELDSNRQVYESLLQRTKETDISGERRSTNIRVIDDAEVPSWPISPNIQRDLMFSFGTSLFFAIGLAFLFELLDNRIHTPQDIQTLLQGPFLGMVPMGNADSGDTESPLINETVSANFAEAIKTIRTNVLFSSAEDGLHTIAVTSATPGEGKSVVAANLAIALAQTGQRVLLIDADMRRPRVHEIFHIEQEPGLSNVITGNAKTADAIRHSRVDGLSLLSSGHIPPNPAELLGSKRYVDFMASLTEHFDWAIIDTPPVLAVTDSAVAGRHASGVMFVVASDKVSRQAAKDALTQIESAGVHIIGTILNRVDLVKHPYYYGSYYRKEYAKYYVKA